MNTISNFKLKLNKFIDKYYKIQLYKGLLYTLIIGFSTIFIVSVLEFFSYFSSSLRFFILSFLLLTFIFLFLNYIFVPLLRFFNIGKRITFRDASVLIQNIFPGIDDAIINIIELDDNANNYQNLLIESSIEQKINSLDNFDFQKGLKLSSVNFLYPYFIGIFLLILISFVIQPKIYTDGSKRILDYSTFYEKPLPFVIQLSDTIDVYRNEDFSLNVFFRGTDIPTNCYIKFGSSENLMQNINDSTFRFDFKNLNNSFNFYLFSDEFQSKPYLINIIDKPIFQNLKCHLTYPTYLSRKSEYIEDIYEFSVPYGSNIQFVISSLYTDSAIMIFDSTTHGFHKNDDNYVLNHNLTNNVKYDIVLVKDGKKYNFINDKIITVIPDLYPTIKTSHIVDNDNFNVFHFEIVISDDYGFSKLLFQNEQDTINVPINQNLLEQTVYFSYDYSNALDSVSTSFFTVIDNDEPAGFKATLSKNFNFKKLSINELIAEQNTQSKAIENKLDKSLSLAQELQKDINDLQKELIVSNLSEWEKKNKIENIVDKQKELEKLINDIANDNKNKNKLTDANNKLKSDILKKQALLQQNMENIMTDEMKALLKELEKLQEEFDSKKLNNMVDELDMNYDELNKSLDRNLEQLKKYKIEEQIDQTILELNHLKDKQLELSKSAENKLSNLDSLNNLSNEDLKDFKKLMDNYNKLLEENSTLDKPMELENFDTNIEDIVENFQDDNESENDESESNSDDNGSDKETSKENDKLSKKSKENSKKLKELSEDMQSMMSSSQEGEEGENAETMRLLLDNLFYFSFSQEDLLNSIKDISLNNPKYIDLQINQLQLSIDFSIISDSLNALSKRSLELSAQIDKACFSINSELKSVNEFYDNRKKSGILTGSQNIMQHSNDMILILSESLKNSQSGGGGGGSSKKKQKPKKGEPSLGDMRKSQEDMMSEMKSMLEQMKKGQKPGQGMSKQQMGQMLAKQEIFQQMLNELSNGSGMSPEVNQQLKDIKKLLEFNKRDLINMQLNDNTYLRQQQIVTRLLEAENAELERDKDNKRESQEVTDYKSSNSKKYFDQYYEKTNFDEIILYENINLEPFYKNLFNDYLDNINAN